MRIITTIDEMKTEARGLKSGGKVIGLVLTMGYLHEGHLSLVRKSLATCDVTVVSIFVNPTQFGPAEDFKQYPRDMDRDTQILEKMGALRWFNNKVFESRLNNYFSIRDLIPCYRYP